jgi:hypothetical protein
MPLTSTAACDPSSALYCRCWMVLPNPPPLKLRQRHRLLSNPFCRAADRKLLQAKAGAQGAAAAGSMQPFPSFPSGSAAQAAGAAQAAAGGGGGGASSAQAIAESLAQGSGGKIPGRIF